MVATGNYQWMAIIMILLLGLIYLSNTMAIISQVPIATNFWAILELNTTKPNWINQTNNIPYIQTNNFILQDRQTNETRRVFWDIFIKDYQLFVLIPRYANQIVNWNRVYFTFTKNKRMTKISNIRYRRYESIDPWWKSEPNDVAIGCIDDKITMNFLKERHQLNDTHIDITIHFPNLGVMRPYKIPIESTISTYVTQHNYQLVTATIIGNDTTVLDIETWIKYYQQIGMQHFILYFLKSLHIQSHAFVHRLGQIASECNYCFSIAQWHPYHVSGRHPIIYDVPASYLGFIHSAVYRLKSFKEVSKKKTKDVYLSILDTDDFLVVHPNYTNLIDMVNSYPQASTSAILFHNIYFYLVNHTTKQPIRVNSFSMTDWKDNYIIHETNIETHTHRPKLIFNTRNTIFPGAHDIYEMNPNSCRQGSRSFYFHYLKPSKGRDSSYITKPSSMKNISHFLDLPRKYSYEKDFPINRYNQDAVKVRHPHILCGSGIPPKTVHYTNDNIQRVYPTIPKKESSSTSIKMISPMVDNSNIIMITKEELILKNEIENNNNNDNNSINAPASEMVNCRMQIHKSKPRCRALARKQKDKEDRRQSFK